MHIVEADARHPLRNAIERHIGAAYRHAFDARVTTFARSLFVAIDRDGEIRCAAGVRRGSEAFHCEHYLDVPAEQAIALGLRRPVCRDEILEFSTLACHRPGDALGFISQIVQQGRVDGCELALFTGTAPLRRLLARAGLDIVPLTRANRLRVPDPEAWGQYYAHDPKVCVAPDSPLVAPQLRAPCFTSSRRFAVTDSAALNSVAHHA